MDHSVVERHTSGKVVCVVVAHYHNQGEVVAFVEHVRGLPIPPGWTVDFCIADNSRNWDSESGVKGYGSVFRPDVNLHYFGGCAFALERWSTENEGLTPAMVVVCNTDIRFDRNTISEIIGTHWSTNVAVIAPDILDVHSQPQNPFMRMRPSRLRMRFLAGLFGTTRFRTLVMKVVRSSAFRRLRGAKDGLKRLKFRTESDFLPALQTIYAAHGSVLFLTERFFKAGCTVAMPWRMFGEEIHVAEQVRDAGLVTVFVPHAHVRHLGSSTMDRVDGETLMDWKREAGLRLVDTYFRR